MLNCLYQKICLPLLLGLLLVTQASFCLARSEQDIKAAYLYNFIKFISWPNFTNKQTFNLCILGEDPLNQKLKQLHQRPIHGSPLQILKLSRLDSPTQCSVVFIGHSEERFLDDIFASLRLAPVLTVSTIDDFATLGGTIGFITLGNVVRFDINLKHAQHANLTISSKLLELANKVVK